VKLIVGLGNPGKQYEETRHNVGFKVIDELSNRMNIELNETKFKGLYGRGMVHGEKVILLKPMTYMNLSGESVSGLMRYYDITESDLLVCYDELDLPVGKIRLRYKGSAGGHNGIKSIINLVGTQEFNRIRIGIDRPQPGSNIADYVLGKFNPEDKILIQDMVKKSAEACEEWLEKPFLDVMNIYNQ
jgi:peptidyl-tRNA hydrolase, PTH1 family